MTDADHLVDRAFDGLPSDGIGEVHDGDLAMAAIATPRGCVSIGASRRQRPGPIVEPIRNALERRMVSDDEIDCLERAADILVRVADQHASDDEWLTTQEVAEEVGCQTRLIVEAIVAGDLAATTTSRGYVIRTVDMEASRETLEAREAKRAAWKTMGKRKSGA